MEKTIRIPWIYRQISCLDGVEFMPLVPIFPPSGIQFQVSAFLQLYFCHIFDIIKAKTQMFLLIWFISFIPLGNTPSSIFITENGSVSFSSEAPLELINARSESLRGIIDTEKNTFAFLIPMNSFKGFNDPLQKEHFCEKFMECNKFPQSTFEGKIIETVSFEKIGTYQVRAKGKFTIHGISQERIIKAQILISENGIDISSEFSVKLVDHKIKVPKIVYNKVAEIIQVNISSHLTSKNP